MSDDRSEADGRRIDRRAVLKSVAAGAVGVGGLVAVAADDSAAAVPAGAVRTQGELTPVEAARKLRRAEEFDGFPAPDSACYTETKCVGGCSGNGTVAERTCCPNIVGCGECCQSWNYTNICC